MQIHLFLIKWQEWLKEYSTKLSQNISTWNYIPFAVSYQNTLLKPENPTQGHMTSRHKDVKYATKTSSYATKTSIRHMDGVPRYQCHKDYGIWLGNHMSRSKGKHMKSSQFTWNQNTVQFLSSFTKTFEILNIFTMFSNFPKSFIVNIIFYQFPKYHKSR